MAVGSVTRADSRKDTRGMRWLRTYEKRATRRGRRLCVPKGGMISSFFL